MENKKDMLSVSDDQLDQVSGGTILPYIVKPGDTLVSIAKKYNVKVEDLIRWNNLPGPNAITVGQHLRIIF